MLQSQTSLVCNLRPAFHAPQNAPLCPPAPSRVCRLPHGVQLHTWSHGSTMLRECSIPIKHSRARTGWYVQIAPVQSPYPLSNLDTITRTRYSNMTTSHGNTYISSRDTDTEELQHCATFKPKEERRKQAEQPTHHLINCRVRSCWSSLSMCGLQMQSHGPSCCKHLKGSTALHQHYSTAVMNLKPASTQPPPSSGIHGTSKQPAESLANGLANDLYRKTSMFPESDFWYTRRALQLRISFSPVKNQKSTHPCWSFATDLSSCQKRGVAYPRLPYLRQGVAMLLDRLVPLVIRPEVTTNGWYVQRTRGSEGAHY